MGYFFRKEKTVRVQTEHHTNKLAEGPDSKQKKDAVWKYLGKDILCEVLPGKPAIEDCMTRAGKVLRGRTFKNIKDFCRNAILSRKKKP